MEEQSRHDKQAINQLLKLAKRGIKPNHSNVELAFDALAHLGALSDDLDDGCSLLLTSSLPPSSSFLRALLDLLIWSINGAFATKDGAPIDPPAEHNHQHPLPKRRARAQNKEGLSNKFYTDRITTVLLRLLFNLITFHLDTKIKHSGAMGVKRIALATEHDVDHTIVDLSSFLMLQLRHTFCPGEKKPNFDLTLLILSRTVELEAVRLVWMQDDEQKEHDDAQAAAHFNPDLDVHPVVDGMHVLIGILESSDTLTLTNYSCTYRILNLLIKWHHDDKSGKEKAMPCIAASVEILEMVQERVQDMKDEQHNPDKDSNDAATHIEHLMVQCFGFLASLTYNCVAVQEEVLSSGIATPCIQTFQTYHHKNPAIVIQCLGFLSSFMSRGGPKAALSMIDGMLTSTFISSLLETCQLYPRREQIQRLATNTLAFVVAIVVCNIKENDVDSELSDEEANSDLDNEDDEDDEDDEDSEGEKKGKKGKKVVPPTKIERLFDLYTELNVIQILVGVATRLKLLEESYLRRNDMSKDLYFQKTKQSIGLINTFHSRQLWKREHPDESDED